MAPLCTHRRPESTAPNSHAVKLARFWSLAALDYYLCLGPVNNCCLGQSRHLKQIAFTYEKKRITIKDKPYSNIMTCAYMSSK